MIKVRSLHTKPYITADDEKRSMSMTVAWSRINRGSNIWLFFVKLWRYGFPATPRSLAPRYLDVNALPPRIPDFSLVCCACFFSSRLLALMRSRKLLRSTQETLPVTSLESSSTICHHQIYFDEKPSPRDHTHDPLEISMTTVDDDCTTRTD